MDFYKRRRLSIVAICGYLFLGGLEFAVIFPSAWEYIQSLGVEDEYMLGFTLSAYSFSGALAGIIGGHLADVYPKKTGILCMICIILMVLGNLQYTIGLNIWNVVASRLLCGVGTAAGAALLAYVCRVTTANERTAIISICNASRQMGVLFGPACQVLLTKIDMRIGPVYVNSTNAAGLLMATLWFVGYLPMHLFLGRYDYTSMPLENYEILRSQSEDPKETSGSRKHSMSSLLHHSFIDKEQASHTEASSFRENLKYYRCSQCSKETDLDAPSFTEQLKQLSETNQLIPQKEFQLEDSSDESLSRDPSPKRHGVYESGPMLRSSRSSVASIANMMASISVDPGYSITEQNYQPSFQNGIMSDVFVSLLGTAFTLFFCQVLIETIIPVYMKDVWGFGEIAISMAYLVGGLECLIIFAALIPLSHHVSDTILQLVGKLLLMTGFIILLVVLPYMEIGRMNDFYYFIGGCFTVGFAYPIASVSNASLLSKSLPNETQGMGQGLRRFASYMGLILGPLWGGSAVRNPSLLMGVALTIVLIHALMFFLTMKKLRQVERNAVYHVETEDNISRNNSETTSRL